MPGPEVSSTVTYDLTNRSGDRIQFVAVPTPTGHRIDFQFERTINAIHYGTIWFDGDYQPYRLRLNDPSKGPGYDAWLTDEPELMWKYFLDGWFPPSEELVTGYLPHLPLFPLMAHVTWNQTLPTDAPTTKTIAGVNVSIRTEATAESRLVTLHLSRPFPEGEMQTTMLLDMPAKGGFATRIEGAETAVESTAGRIPTASGAASVSAERPCYAADNHTTQTPMDGDPAKVPFPFGQAMEAAKATTTWKTFSASNPAWTVVSARLRDRGDDPVNPLVPEFTWRILVRANVPDKAQETEFVVWKTGGPNPQVMVREETARTGGSLPPGTPSESRLPSLSNLVAAAGAPARIELSHRLTPAAADSVRVFQLSSLVYEGSQAPLEHHYGTNGCLLETIRFGIGRL